MKRVLLADDEQSSIDIIRFFIRKHQLPLEISGQTMRGDDTVEAIKRLAPDIVFLDIEMPVLNGLQVMDAISVEHSLNVTFIVMSAYNSFDYVQRALRLNAKDYLLKPIMFEQFCETMHRVLGYRYSQNSLCNQLMEYIDLHYMEELSLDECATELATSKSNVVRLFKQYLNTSFTAYYNEVRIRRARKLLEEGYSIKYAAASVGYNNLNYFYRMFKAQAGVTPKEFVSRQSHKTEPEKE